MKGGRKVMEKRADLHLSKRLRYLPLVQCLPPAQVSLQYGLLSLLEKQQRANQSGNSKLRFSPTTLTAVSFPLRSKGLKRFGRSRCLFPCRRIGTDRTLIMSYRQIRGAQSTSIPQKDQLRFLKMRYRGYRSSSSVTERTE